MERPGLGPPPLVGVGDWTEAPHPEFSGYHWVPVNHGHRPFGAGGTHTSKQCAADSSHLSATSTAPQRCSRRRSHRLTCHGHSPRPAALPPTILVSAAAGARPQSAGEAGVGRRSDHASSTQTAQLRPGKTPSPRDPGPGAWSYKQASSGLFSDNAFKFGSCNLSLGAVPPQLGARPASPLAPHSSQASFSPLGAKFPAASGPLHTPAACQEALPGLTSSCTGWSSWMPRQGSLPGSSDPVSFPG